MRAPENCNSFVNSSFFGIFLLFRVVCISCNIVLGLGGTRKNVNGGTKV